MMLRCSYYRLSRIPNIYVCHYHIYPKNSIKHERQRDKHLSVDFNMPDCGEKMVHFLKGLPRDQTVARSRKSF